MSIGERIRARREELALTQRELAQRLDCDVMTLSRWERDAAEPRLSAAQELARALGISLEELIGVPATGTDGA